MTQGGRILLTSSISARIAVYQHTLYAASKAAVSAMVLNLAPELAERGIGINAIAPGGTNTDMAAKHAASYTPPVLRDLAPEVVVKSMNSLGRWAEPAEIASVAAFCSRMTRHTSQEQPSTPRAAGCRARLSHQAGASRLASKDHYSQRRSGPSISRCPRWRRCNVRTTNDVADRRVD